MPPTTSRSTTRPHVAQPASISATLLIVVAGLLWGTGGIAVKALYGLAAIDALAIGCLRMLLAALVLAPLCWRATGGRMLRIPPRDLALMLLLGAAVALYQICFYAAVAYAGAAVGVLLTHCLSPILVALFSARVLRERLTGRVVAALAAAVAGTALLLGVQPDSAGVPERLLLGGALSVGAALGGSGMFLTSRTLLRRYHPLQPLVIGFGAGALLLLPAAIRTGMVITYGPAAWLLLLHMGVAVTALAYWLLFTGMCHASATVASILSLLEPVTTVALAALLLHEQLGTITLAGAGLVLGAVALVSLPQRRAAPPRDTSTLPAPGICPAAHPGSMAPEGD